MGLFVRLLGTRRVSLTPAETQATWVIDPQNVSGVASDGNSGIDASSPLVTYAELAERRWQTYSPRLRQSTTLTFLSSHPDNSDPVYLTPHLEAGASCIVQATPAVVTSGVVLSGVTAKNRAAGSNSLLIANLGATAAAGQLVRNTTGGKLSRAWTYKALGGNSFSLTQPLVPFAPPAIAAPAEVDTWANGDTVDLLTPLAINLVELGCTNADANATTSAVYAYQCTAFDPSATGEPLFVGDRAMLAEVASQRALILQGLSPTIHHTNCLMQKTVSVGTPACSFLGGASLGILSAYCPSPTTLDGDFILGAAANLFAGGQFGFVFLDANVTVTAGLLAVGPVFYASGVLYGSGANTINLQGSAHCVQNTGPFVTAFTAPGLVTGIKLNGAATGNSIAYVANVGTIHNGIATTPANLDAAAGAAGFGSTAFNPGGASVSTS
jgi:hypothetical protein